MTETEQATDSAEQVAELNAIMDDLVKLVAERASAHA